MNWREQMAQALMARQPEEAPPPLEMPGGSPVAPHGIDALPLQIGMQGAAPMAAPKFSLDPINPGDLKSGEVMYAIKDATGRDRGSIHAFIDGDKATIENVASLGKEPGTFGPSGVRDILAAFRANHPEVKSIEGERVSGARFGGATVGHGVTVRQSIEQAMGR